MANFSLNINGQKYAVEVDAGTPLLWVLREHIGLMGTKYGCGISECGSCMIHVNGNPVKACTFPVDGAANGQKVTTIEGLSKNGDHPLQLAFIEAQVPQCGYCQSGQIMQAAALLKKIRVPQERKSKPT